MAKLRHLQDLLERIARVDAARARTLVMKARAAGHFTTGGRGVNAPGMTPRDATNTLLLALQMDAPTEAGEAVTALRALPLLHLRHDPGDRTARTLTRKQFSDSGAEGVALLPEFFEGEWPLCLGDALDVLFSQKGNTLQNRWDQISHLRTDHSVVYLEFADADHDPSNEWQTGSRAWKLIFWETMREHDELGAWTTKKVYAEALRALRDLIHDPAQETASQGADPVLFLKSRGLGVDRTNG